ncbi:MAG: hypothetical protein P8M16_08450 [Acidimicrobiales bacterium]|nr:hypothetical protein [Acidimicrobiales bacterium]
MGVLLGMLSSLSVGASEYFGRRAMGFSGVLTLAILGQGTAAVVSIVLVLVVPGTFNLHDVLIGALSGVGVGVGMVAYLIGLRRSSSTVVAPVVAVLVAVLPAGYVIIAGDRPSIFVFAGVVLSTLGLGLVASGVRVVGLWKGLFWGTVSGLAFGIGMTVLVETSAASGAWPSLMQRGTACLVSVALALGGRVSIKPTTGSRLLGTLMGVSAAGATFLYILGVQADPLPAAVGGAMFPAVTVAVGRLAFNDEVRGWQFAGLSLVLVGIAGVVAG